MSQQVDMKYHQQWMKVGLLETTHEMQKHLKCISINWIYWTRTLHGIRVDLTATCSLHLKALYMVQNRSHCEMVTPTSWMCIHHLNILNSSILGHQSWFHWCISWMPSFKSIVLGDIGSLCEWLHFHHFTQAPAKIAECVDLTYLYLVKSGGDVNCCNCINSLSLPIP